MSGFQLDNLRKGQKYLVIKIFLWNLFCGSEGTHSSKSAFSITYVIFLLFLWQGKRLSLLLVFNITLDNIPIIQIAFVQASNYFQKRKLGNR